jgi:hypothetical protein
MANDDEIVSEGIENPFGKPTIHRETFSAVDGKIVVKGQTFEPVIRTTLGIVGQALYPPLQIVELQPFDGGIARTQWLEFFIIPNTFNETFKSRWKAEDLSDGRINPMYNYGGTQREITLSFTLAAFTVQEAKSNLYVCQRLARMVYGNYRLRDDEETRSGSGTVFGKKKTFIVDFGGLIRDEEAFINKFAFTTDMDAGVFDYSSVGNTDVTHAAKGVILPRAVKIEIGFTIIHDSLLGFGGQNRPGEPIRWAENRKRDWPHGTGKIDVQEYMQPSKEVDLVSLPIVARHGEEGFDDPPDAERRANIIEEARRQAQERLGLEDPRDTSTFYRDNVVPTNPED